MTQFGVNDLRKYSFGADNVVVLITRIFTGNFDIGNMYKCLRSKIALFGYAKLVTVVIRSQWR